MCDPSSDARSFAVKWDPLNLGQLQRAVEQGRLDAGQIITMKALRDAGIISKKIDHGVKLLADVRALLLCSSPVHPSFTEVDVQLRAQNVCSHGNSSSAGICASVRRAVSALQRTRQDMFDPFLPRIVCCCAH
jgi:hypothetical protein